MSPDRPDAQELVDAVAQWLAEELAPGLEGGPRYQALVAAQALAIASRELAHADEHAAADAAALAPVVPDAPPTDAQEVLRSLTEAIATGRHDDDLGELAGILREHVRRKLTVARPGYDDS